MIRLSTTRLFVWVAGLLLAPAFLAAPCQSQNSASLSVLKGTVRDASGQAIPNIVVHLRKSDGNQGFDTRTDSDGSYKFAALKEGVYTLWTEPSGFEPVEAGPCILGIGETKNIDLKLKLKNNSVSSGAAPVLLEPEFSDHSEFTVAGVTDTTSLGGHGSTATVRTNDTLSREIRELDTDHAQQKSPVSAETEKSLRSAAERQPNDFDANRKLGELLEDAGRASQALPYLERASQLRPDDYFNSYALAYAYANAGNLQLAKAKAQSLIITHDEAGLHHLLADIDEKSSDPLGAVHEYQRAAELKPSERNFFDWGAELLTHHAPEPAIDVFTRGNRLFPQSMRMLIGLGVALNARGSTDLAIQRLCEASNLNPDDPAPYLYLGQIESAGAKSANTQPECSTPTLARFARLQPKNAMANYYYALSFWNRRNTVTDPNYVVQVESLLKKALALDPKLAAGYLQLGILNSERSDFSAAIINYQKAIDANSELEEAHYRLAQAYKRAGAVAKAQEEMKIYQQISRNSAEQTERQRHEMQQFVYTLRDQNSSAQSR